MSYTKELLVEELSFIGLVAYYTGGLKIVKEERQRMGKIQTKHIPKLRRLHPTFLFVAVLAFVSQSVNKESIKDFKKLYKTESVWF